MAARHGIGLWRIFNYLNTSLFRSLQAASSPQCKTRRMRENFNTQKVIHSRLEVFKRNITCYMCHKQLRANFVLL